MLIDIGVNLTGSSFRDDREQVIERARQAGVGVLIVTGTTIEHSRRAQELCQRYPAQLYATAGMHPHHAEDFSKTSAAELMRLASAVPCVAVGECGLDFNRNFASKPAQIHCFEAQLEMAAALGLPVFLHERDAHDEFIRLLGRHRDKLVDAVAHCFTGNAEALAAYLDMDLHIGITGWICDERRGQHLRQLVARIPAERLMLETDAPYLLPRDLQPRPATRRNEPMYLAHIRDVVARCRDEDPQQLETSSTLTAQRFFRLD